MFLRHNRHKNYQFRQLSINSIKYQELFYIISSHINIWIQYTYIIKNKVEFCSSFNKQISLFNNFFNQRVLMILLTNFVNWLIFKVIHVFNNIRSARSMPPKNHWSTWIELIKTFHFRTTLFYLKMTDF